MAIYYFFFLIVIRHEEVSIERESRATAFVSRPPEARDAVFERHRICQIRQRTLRMPYLGVGHQCRRYGYAKIEVTTG